MAGFWWSFGHKKLTERADILLRAEMSLSAENQNQNIIPLHFGRYNGRNNGRKPSGRTLSSAYPMFCHRHDFGCTEDDLSKSSLFPSTSCDLWKWGKCGIRYVTSLLLTRTVRAGLLTRRDATQGRGTHETVETVAYLIIDREGK